MPSEVGDAISLRWYLAVLRERWSVVAMGAALGVLFAVAFLLVVDRSYTARTVVSMNVIGSSLTGPNDAASNLIDTSTETQLASSFEVASLASEQLDGEMSPREIRDGVSVSTVGDATVLVVNFAAASPEQARAGADAVALGYLEYRTTVAERRIADAIAFIEVRVAELRTELDALATELVRVEPGSEGELRIETDRSVILESLRTLIAQQFELERIDTSAGLVISPADENSVEVSPPARMVMMGGLLAGALLGAVAAFIVNATSRRVSSQRQLAALLGEQSLGEVPVQDSAYSAQTLELPSVRAATARLLAELGDAERCVVFDATGDSAPSVLPYVLAASLARASNPVNVVVAGVDDEGHNDLIQSLHLTAVWATRSRPSYRSPLSNRLRVFLSPVGGGASEYEAVLAHAGQPQQRGSADGPPIVWVVVTDRADVDVRLRAMNGADVALLVARMGTTERRSIVDFSATADRFGARVVGSVTAMASVASARLWRGGRREHDRDSAEPEGSEPTLAS